MRTLPGQRPKRVCKLITSDAQGDSRVEREASALAMAGYEVTVVARYLGRGLPFERAGTYSIVRLNGGPGILGRLLRRGQENSRRDQRGGVVAGLPDFGLGSLLSVVFLNLQMARFAASLSPDVYHVHEVGALPAGFLAKALAPGPLVYDAHELYSDLAHVVRPSLAHRFFLELVQRVLVPRADVVITINDSIAAEMVRRYRCPRPLVLMNVPWRQVRKVSGGERLSAQLGQPSDTVVALYHGLYGAGRGLEQLVDCAKYLSKAVIALRGYGELEQELRERVRAQGLQAKVFFLPLLPAEQLVESAGAADIGVVPYLPVTMNHRFSLPNKLFEYLMAGLALAASDLPEIRKIVAENRVGVLFDPSDPRSVAAAIEDLAGTPERLAEMRRRAASLAMERLNWEVEGDKLLMAYQRLLGG